MGSRQASLFLRYEGSALNSNAGPLAPFGPALVEMSAALTCLNGLVTAPRPVERGFLFRRT